MDFPNKLMNLALLPSVNDALGLSAKESSSMGAQESILRLISFGHFSPKTKSIEEFLDTVMYQASSGEFSFSQKIENNIISTFEVISSAFDRGEAFKFFRKGKFQGGFSSNLFDIVGCGIYKNILKCRKKTSDEIRARIIELHSQDDAISLTGAGSNTRVKMMGRVDFGKEWFS